jgi:hypothetical protein
MKKKEQPAASGLMVRFVPLTELAEYERNARTHSAEQIQQIVRAVREFGWTAPILADGAGIVAGHGRLQAARMLYAAGETILLPSGQALPTGSVPVIDCAGWGPERRRAYVIADNAIPLNSGWDKALLGEEVLGLKSFDFDLTLLGLPDTTLDKLTAPPEPPEVKEWDLGDVYEPFWLVVRGPLSELHKVRAAIEASGADRLVVEGGAV